ncbi:hypothetical protein BBJ28_00001441 [Nothophytophthora sp. Chile5]|nr:hypothetical protein BBJ28_00001441 [Nothophytophthora sp. Chile5]
MTSISWETPVVGAEISAALAAAVWLAYRRSGRRECLPLVDGSSELATRPPFLQPRGYWSLRALLGFRVGVVTFYVLIQLYDVYRTRARCLAFYTSWNFIVQGVYFGFAAVRTRQVLLRQHEERSHAYTALLDNADYDGSEGPYGERKRVGGARGGGVGWISMDLVLDVCLATSLLISAVVWTVLYPYAVRTGHPERILNSVSYCQHAGNVLLLQLDFFATQHRVSRDALPLMMTWPSLYAIFAWIVHGTIAKGFWPYPFLELHTPWAPVWYGGLLVAHMAALALVLMLSRVKRSSQQPPQTEALDREDS